MEQEIPQMIHYLGQMKQRLQRASNQMDDGLGCLQILGCPLALNTEATVCVVIYHRRMHCVPQLPPD